MRELEISIETIASWFTNELLSPYVLVRVSDEHAASWAEVLGAPVRRCYIDDTLLDERAQATGRPKSELVAAKLPDRGSTMAGDFGEILVFLYHATLEPGVDLVGPKKWRLKQDRTKPAPYSDVVHFVLPHWPVSSTDDRILCSEVKTKSTAGDSSPISSAVADCEKDRTSRLAKTLVLRPSLALKDLSMPSTIPRLRKSFVPLR
jgi:hypothetical protein